MALGRSLLRTMAVLGAGLLTAGACLPATAAEVLPGGVFDLTITGFARFRAHGGQLDDARQDDSFSRSLDFSNDTEFHVLARGRDEKTGMEYGATIEFQADTDQIFNTKETWIFVRGGWGEVRLGDQEGVAENSSVGAQEVAAGTGGIDGDVVDEIAVGKRALYVDCNRDWGSLPDQHRHGDQDPLLHPELRRLQRGRGLHAHAAGGRQW